MSRSIHMWMSRSRLEGPFKSTGPVHTYISLSHLEDPVTRRDPCTDWVLAVRGPPRVIYTFSRK